MDLITGMDYRNGHLCVCWIFFNIVVDDKLAWKSESCGFSTVKLCSAKLGYPCTGAHIHVGHCHSADIFLLIYTSIHLVLAVQHPLMPSV